MAGLSDGLFERFLSAAIATVITFVLSWRFILEYKAGRVLRRSVKDIDEEENVDDGLGDYATRYDNNNGGPTSAYSLESDMMAQPDEMRFSAAAEGVRQTYITPKYVVSPTQPSQCSENTGKRRATNMSSLCRSNINISRECKGRSCDNNLHTADQPVVLELGLNQDLKQNRKCVQPWDSTKEVPENDVETGCFSEIFVRSASNNTDKRILQNSSSCSIRDVPKDTLANYPYTPQTEEYNLEDELQSVTIVTKDSTVNIEYRQILEEEDYQSLLDLSPESSVKRRRAGQASSEDAVDSDDAITMASNTYCRKESIWGYQPGLQTITELPWEDMNVDWDSDVSDVDIDVDSVTGSVRLVPKGSDSEDDSEGEYDCCDTNIQGTDGGDLANLELRGVGYYPSLQRNANISPTETTEEGAAGPSLKCLVTNALSGNAETVTGQVNIYPDSDDNFTTRNERLQRPRSAVEDNKIISEGSRKKDYVNETDRHNGSLASPADDQIEDINADLPYSASSKTSVPASVENALKSQPGLFSVDNFNSANTLYLSTPCTRQHKRCAENDDKLRRADDSGPDNVNTDNIAYLSTEKPLTNHSDKFNTTHCKALVNSVRGLTAMTFDEPKAGSAEKIRNDYSPKQFVSTEVLRVSQFEKTHNQTNADDGSCVCSYPEVRSVHTNKINANVTGKQKQTRPIQAGGSVCDSGTEIRQSSEISFRLSSGCSITFERKWGNQNRLIENENNDPGSENKASAEQELIIDRNTGGAIQKKEKFNSVELSVECSGESDRSKATNVVQYGSYRPLQYGLSSSDSNVVLEQERTTPRGGLLGTVVTIAERGGANTNCQLRSESPSKLNDDDSRKCSVDKSYQDIKQLQVSQVIERVSQPISRPLSDKTSLKYIDAPESDCVNDLYGIDTSALTFTELSSVLSDNFNVTRETKCNKQSYEYGSDGAIMTCGRPSDDGHTHHWTHSGHSEPATPRTTHDHNTRVKEVNKQGHSKLTIKANTADKSAKMADNRGLSPGVKPKIKSRGVLYQNTHTFDLVASKLDRRPGIRENTPVIDHDLKINSWDSTGNDYNKQGVDREGLDPRDRHSDKPLFNDTRQTIQQVSKHDSKYQGSRDLHVFQSRDNSAYEHITLNTRTANQIPKGGDSNKTSDHIANETSGLLKGPDTDNKFNNGTYNADCVSRSSIPERDTIPVTTHNFRLPGNSPGEEICTNPVNGRNDARGGDLTHGLMNGNEKTGQDNEAVDRNMRYNDIPLQPVTAIATSTAVARQEIESDSLGRPGSPLRRPVVSAVASAEASGLNPFFAVARATAHAASIASANATSGVATTRGHAMVPSDVTVVMSTSCTLNAASDQNILQDANDVSGAMIGSDVMKVSVRSASASPFGAGGSSSANSLPVTKADNTNASFKDRRSPYQNAMQNTRDEYEQSHASNDASVQTVRTYLPRSVSPTKRLGPMERHILRDDSFNRRLKTPDRLLSPEASPSASPTRALKANIPSWYKEMHYRPSRNDDDDDECDHVKGNLDSKRHHSPVKMRSASPKDSQRKHTILNTTNDFITGGVPEVPSHAENAPPRPPPPKNYNTAPSRPEKTYSRNTGSVSSLDSVNQQKRPQPPPKTYKSVLQEPVSAPVSPAQPYYHDTNDSRPDALVPPSKMKSKVSRQLFLRGSPQNQELSGAASESAKSRFERESHHKDKAHVPVPKVEDMDLPGINSGANKTSPSLDLKEKLRKARPKSLTVSRNDIDQAIAEAKAKSLQRASKTKSMDNIYMCHAGPHTHPSKFFIERASTPCLLETDLDTGKETRTLLYQETNLDEVLSPISKAKSMMELTSSRRSNKLEKGSNDVPLSDGDLSSDQHSQSTYGLRVSKSLQKLTVPDWYKASPVSHKPKEGVYLKNANSAGDIFSPSPRPAVSPPAMSRQQLGSRPVITPCRVTPPLSVSSNKSSPTTPTSQLSSTKFELPSAKFRQSPNELKRIENRWGSGSPTGSTSVVPKTKQSPTSNGPGTNGQQEEDGQQEPTYDPVINEICAQIDAITAQTQGNSPTEGKPLPPKPEVNMQLAFEAVQRFFTPPQSPARPFDTAGSLSKESSIADLYYYTPPVERRTMEWDAPEPTGRHSRNLSSHAGRSTPATMASSRPSSAMSAFGRSSGNHTPFPILQFAEAQENESPRESSTPKPLRHNELEVTFTETNLDDSDEEWDGGLAEDVFEDSLENASMEEVLNGLLSLPNDTQSPTRAQADSLEGGPEKTGVQNFMTSALQESPMSSMLSLDASGTSVDLSMFSLNMSADSTQSIHYLEEEIPPEKTSTEVVDDEKVLVKCRYPQCCKVQVLKEARKSYKTCHHCYTYYCSRQCRKMHWDSHKKRCLYSRVSSVCKNVIKKINKDQDLLYHVSRVARTGYLSRGRGYVHIYFDTPDAASEMLEKGMDFPPELKYVSVKELENQLDNEKLSELHAFAKKYNPEFKFVVHVCILAAKEIPVKPTPRLAGPLIHKCAKLRLSAAHIKTKPGAKEEQETLILTAVPGAHELEELGPQKAREVCFINIQRKLRQRGVSLRHMYPTVYNQVCDYVANNEEFAPILILPYDGNTGKRFMCIIMPKSDPEMDWLEAKRLMKDLDLSMDARDNNVNAATVAASAEVNGSSIPSR